MTEQLLAEIKHAWAGSSTKFFHRGNLDDSIEDCCGRLILEDYLPRVIIVGRSLPYLAHSDW
jgi:hypothetical protein